MAQKARREVKVEETSKEIHCTALGLKYRSKMVRIVEVLGTPEGQTEIDQHCGSTAAKFRDLCAKIGMHIPAAMAVEILMGGSK